MAQQSAWTGYDGKGMNARNDYTLISRIAEITGQTPPPFEEWQRIVERGAS